MTFCVRGEIHKPRYDVYALLKATHSNRTISQPSTIDNHETRSSLNTN